MADLHRLDAERLLGATHRVLAYIVCFGLVHDIDRRDRATSKQLLEDALREGLMLRQWPVFGPTPGRLVALLDGQGGLAFPGDRAVDGPPEQSGHGRDGV